MEGIDLTTDKNSPGDDVASKDTSMDITPTVSIETEPSKSNDNVNPKKRKENPLDHEEESEEIQELPPNKIPNTAADGIKSHDSSDHIGSSRRSIREKKSISISKAKEEREEMKKREELEKQQHQAEKAAKKLAAEEAKRQKDLQKEAEKKAKEAEKEAKEAEKKQKEEEKQKAKLHKEEEKLRKEAQKEEEKKKKEEENKRKEEERKAKEEEKKKKTEEKLQLRAKKDEEQDSRKKEKEKKQDQEKRQVNAMMAFVAKAATTPTKSINPFEKVGKFLAYEAPNGAILPKRRNILSSNEDNFAIELNETGSSMEINSKTNFLQLFISNAKSRPERLSSVHSKPLASKYEDAFEAIPECPKKDQMKKLVLDNPIKLIILAESFRPPFFGTWSRKSKLVSGKRPFAHSEDIDYELSSDEESFDDGGEGDSIESQGLVSENSSGETDLDEYEFDDQFLVPDGGISSYHHGGSSGQSSSLRGLTKIKNSKPNGKSDGSDDDDDEEDDERDSSQDSDEIDLDDEQVEAPKLSQAELISETKKRLKSNHLGHLTPKLHIWKPEIDKLEDSNPIKTLFTIHSIHPLLPTPISLNPIKASNTSSSHQKKEKPQTIEAELLPKVAAFIHECYLASTEKLLPMMRDQFPTTTKKQRIAFIREYCEKVKTTTRKQGVWLVKMSARAALQLPLEDPTPPQPSLSVTSTENSTNTSCTSNSTETKAKPKRERKKKESKPKEAQQIPAGSQALDSFVKSQQQPAKQQQQPITSP